MTIRQARSLAGTVLKFGDPLQIEAKRVMDLGAEIRDIDLSDFDNACPTCGGCGNHFSIRVSQLDDTEEAKLHLLLEAMRSEMS